MADTPIPIAAGSASFTKYAPTIEATKTAYSASITLPALGATGLISSVGLPALGATGTLLPGGITSETQTAWKLPALQASGTLIGESTYKASITLPALGASGSAGNVASVKLPGLKASGTIIPGTVARGIIGLPALQASGTILPDSVATASVQLPALGVAATVLPGSIVEAGISLPALAVAAKGYTGSVASAAITLPVLGASGEMYGDASMSASITLPMLQLVATLTQTNPAIAYETTVMNARIAAVSTYTGINANSLAEFNELTLWAGPGGIFAIGGTKDDGVIIDALARTGITDMGAPEHKRVVDAYVGYRADGEMRLKVTTDEHHEYEYRLYPRNYGEIHGNRVKLGKGVRGRYWQFEIGNVDGSAIDVDEMAFDAEIIPRRI